MCVCLTCLYYNILVDIRDKNSSKLIKIGKLQRSTSNYIDYNMFDYCNDYFHNKNANETEILRLYCYYYFTEVRFSNANCKT